MMAGRGIEIISSNKGGQKLCFEGYIYNKVKTAVNNYTYWRCYRRYENCTGAVKTSDVNQDVEIIKEHAYFCLPDLEKIEALKERNRAKFRARNSQEPPSRIFANSLAGLSPGGRLSLGSENAFVRTMQRIRSVLFPATPATLADLSIDGVWAQTYADSPAPFLVSDNKNELNNNGRCLIFASPAGLNLLSESTLWFMDGNFKASPASFLQLYVIRVPLGSTAVSVVYCIMERKSKRAYLHVFESILNKLRDSGLRIHVQRVMCDFEKAVFRAIEIKLGNGVTIAGCFYHLSQAVWRRIQDLGLVTLYKENPNISLFCCMMLALAFLPIDEVIEGMNHLKTTVPVELRALLEYFDVNWVSGPALEEVPGGEPNVRPPRFPPALWNHHNQTLLDEPRTNNQCEGWNTRFYHLVGYHHPSIWVLIDALKKEEAKVSTIIDADARGEPPSKRRRRDYETIQKRMKTLCHLRATNRKSIPRFLTGIAYNIGRLNKSEDYGHDMAEEDEDEGNPPVAAGAADIGDEGQGVEEDDIVVEQVNVDQNNDQVVDVNVIDGLNHPHQGGNVVIVEDFAGGENDVVHEGDGAQGIIENDDIPVDQRCGVCWGDRNDPTLLLPCGHTFCGACVTVLMADLLPSCPQCRVVVVDSIRVFT